MLNSTSPASVPASYRHNLLTSARGGTEGSDDEPRVTIPNIQLRDSFERRPASVPLGVYHGDITQCPVDALVVGFYKDTNLLKNTDLTDVYDEADLPTPDDKIHTVDQAIGHLLQNTIRPYRSDVGRVTIRSKAYHPTSTAYNTTKQWGIPAKHVIIVGLGDRPTQTTPLPDILCTLQQAHQAALRAMQDNPTLADVKTATTLLHGLENSRQETAIRAASKAARISAHSAESDERLEAVPLDSDEPFTPQTGPLQTLYIATEHPDTAKWIADELGISTPKTNMLIPEPTQPGFLKRAWNSITSVWTVFRKAPSAYPASEST